MSKHLYKFELSCGRMGYLDGLFIATEEIVNKIIGKEVCFGEVLGKHSDIFAEIKKHHITKIDIDSETLGKLRLAFGSTLCGYNPLEYIEEE